MIPHLFITPPLVILQKLPVIPLPLTPITKITAPVYPERRLPILMVQERAVVHHILFVDILPYRSSKDKYDSLNTV